MAHYLQQVLTSFATPGPDSQINTTISTSSSQTASLDAPSSDLITFLLGFSALRDWLKLFVIGAFFETCRRLSSFFYTKINDSFFINATFSDTDASYEWIMTWLSKQPEWRRSRDIEISTSGNTSTAVTLDGDEDNSSTYMKSSRKLTYLPSFSRSYSLWYKRRWVIISRSHEQLSVYNREQFLHLSILTRDNRFLIELLQEARQEYIAAQEHSVCVYASDPSNSWRHVACRSKRSMNSVILDPGVKDLLIEDAQDFLDSKKWYQDRGLPFRRGYLLYGAPGSGKTSLIHCIAGELNLDVYVLSLSRSGMDDSALDELVNDLPERCIALMEDIDAAFTHGLNRDSPSNPTGPGADQPAQAPTSSSRLSLSGLLNALDGISAQEGRILIATTNKYSSLDPALCRPGRMDLHIEFKLASKYQARELFSRFYLPSQSEDDTESTAKETSTDSGYNSLSETPPDSSTSVDSKHPLEEISFAGQRHRRRSPRLSLQQVDDLANQFAEAIPEREFSMASLQGYLMIYKVRPFEAVQAAEAWVEKERQDKVKEKEKWEREEKEKREKEEKERREKEKASEVKKD